MKRIIKFRVWNGEQMVSPDYIDRNGVAHWKENSIPQISDELMQFTGLKDKNKARIYEGDIITYRWEDRKGDEVVNHVIKWENGRFLMCPIRSIAQTWNIHLHPYNEEAEVIGNIYENPELIKP